jgi:hypothetical protein
MGVARPLWVVLADRQGSSLEWSGTLIMLFSVPAAVVSAMAFGASLLGFTDAAVATDADGRNIPIPYPGLFVTLGCLAVFGLGHGLRSLGLHLQGRVLAWQANVDGTDIAPDAKHEETPQPHGFAKAFHWLARGCAALAAAHLAMAIPLLGVLVVSTLRDVAPGKLSTEWGPGYTTFLLFWGGPVVRRSGLGLPGILCRCLSMACVTRHTQASTRGRVVIVRSVPAGFHGARGARAAVARLTLLLRRWSDRPDRAAGRHCGRRERLGASTTAGCGAR